MNKYLKFLLSPKKVIRSSVSAGVALKLREFNFIPIDETKPEDVFIVGFPKSGNTWMQSLISGLVFGIDTQFLPSLLFNELVPDVHYKTFYKRFVDNAFFKSHHLPKPNYKRVIYLIRDGRDAMVSYYAMHKAMGVNVSLDEMIKNGERVFPTKWHLHVNEWVQNPFNADILILKYEDLVTDTFSQMKKVCSFIGIERDDETIYRVVKGCSFGEMKRKAIQFGLENDKWGMDRKFFRKGKVGSYEEEMPNELVDYFIRESSNELKMFGYNF